MKSKLILLPLFSTVLLQGCVVAPAHDYPVVRPPVIRPVVPSVIVTPVIVDDERRDRGDRGRGRKRGHDRHERDDD